MSDKAKTSPRVASEASSILRSKRYGIKPKSVAGSDLAQAPDKPKGGALARAAKRYRMKEN
jgi:hypothetical protein